MTVKNAARKLPSSLLKYIRTNQKTKRQKERYKERHKEKRKKRKGKNEA